MVVTDPTQTGFELRYIDTSDGVQSGEHVERVTFRAARHLHTRHTWPDGTTTRGRYWFGEWRERVSASLTPPSMPTARNGMNHPPAVWSGFTASRPK